MIGSFSYRTGVHLFHYYNTIDNNFIVVVNLVPIALKVNRNSQS